MHLIHRGLSFYTSKTKKHADTDNVLKATRGDTGHIYEQFYFVQSKKKLQGSSFGPENSIKLNAKN